MTFSYDGSSYHGYQKQIGAKTVQEVVENTLTTIAHQKILIHASGRTDAMVHALNQKGHFDFPFAIDCLSLQKACNSLLPNDIYVKKVEKVQDDFHARYNITKKEYMYLINMGEYSPFYRNYVNQYGKRLDIEKMKEGAKYFIGKYDFKAFSKADIQKEDYVREIFDISIILMKGHPNILVLTFVGTGFLRYMVRNMVGTLIEVGEGKKTPDDIKGILLSRDRTKAGPTADPRGLYLKDVFYD